MLSIANFLKSDEAVTAVEYAVMLAMILLAAFSAIGFFGLKTAGLWDSMVSKVHAIGM
jgi:Flp pilus assembly pilin Flp